MVWHRIQEHRLIMEAIRDKDADRAEELANRHIINAYHNMKNKRLFIAKEE